MKTNKTSTQTPATTATTADALLRDMAFVLAMTRKVRDDMTRDPNPAAAAELPIPFRSVSVAPTGGLSLAAA